MPTELLTTREAAQLLGVGTTSVKRWADSGLLRCVKTPGGHRRFPRDAVGEFIRSHGEAAEVGDRVSAWIDLLTGGSAPTAVRKALAAERTSHGSWWQAADALGPVLEELGRRWEIGDITVLQEHLGSERFARAVARCGEDLPPPESSRTALLLAAQGDDHTLGLSLVELVLREAGWHTRWSGRRTPLEHAVSYIESRAVELVAMSASVYSTDAESLASQVERLGAACEPQGVTLALGGAGLWPARPRYGHRLHDFQGFHDLLESLDRA